VPKKLTLFGRSIKNTYRQEVKRIRIRKVFSHQIKKRRDKFMKKTLVTLMTALVVAQLFVSVALAGDNKTVQVKATIPTQNTLNVAISKVIGTAFTTATAVDFGTLVLDPTYNIFKTADGSYFAVDVGINSNATNWTVTHAVTSMANGTANLDNKINVSFINQQSTSTGLQLSKVAYTASNGKVINKADITAGGWLRIYYGLATGTGDATGVAVIPATQLGGAYAGVITLTLAP